MRIYIHTHILNVYTFIYTYLCICTYIYIVFYVSINKLTVPFFSSEQKSKFFVLFRVLSLRIEGKMFL